MQGQGIATLSYIPLPGFVSLIKRRPLWLMLAGLLFGSLQLVVFAPFNYWYMLPVSVLPLIWCLEYLPAGRASWFSYWYGAGFWLATTHWIYNSFTHFASTSLILSGLLVGLFALAMAFFWVIHAKLWKLISRPFGFYGYITVPLALKSMLFAASWLVVEWLRSTIFQGFPWLLTGYSLMEIPFVPITSWLPIVGVWGLSAMAILFCSALFYILVVLFSTNFNFIQKLSKIAFLLILPIALVAASWILPRDWSVATGDKLTLGLVQPSIALNEKWDPALSTRNLLILQQLSVPLVNQVDVIVWPESAIAGTWENRKKLIGAIINSLHPTKLVTGTLRYSDYSAGSRVVHNSIGDFSSIDSPEFYDKRQLVPFGEFMPFYNQLSGILIGLGFPVSNLAPSVKDSGVFNILDFSFVASICYEVIFPSLISRDAWQGQALLNISDDGWFGASVGPQQHFQMARARAIENARPMVRVGNDGITALINHKGEVESRLPRFARDSLIVTVEGRTGRSIISYLGDWIVLLLALVPVLVYLTIGFVLRGRIE